MFFDVERTVFAVKAFTHMDTDGNHQIDFPEFVPLPSAAAKQSRFHLGRILGQGLLGLRLPVEGGPAALRV